MVDDNMPLVLIIHRMLSSRYISLVIFLSVNEPLGLASGRES